MSMAKSDEEMLIGILGGYIGFGNIMQLCERIWRKRLGPSAGGELTVGPAAAMLVRCPHPELTQGGHCVWCCGSGRITKRVLRAIEEVR
jgi:hypothetical protein